MTNFDYLTLKYR